eukprot:COSAG04_NODE_2893_length_3413_cov_19.095957_2_plen_284_part_00
MAAILHSAAPADDDFGVADVVTVDDDSIEGVLSSHRIVVVAGCHSEDDCEALRAELGRAAKILKRVSMSGGSVALGSVALHEASTTACQERYRLPPPGDGGSASWGAGTRVIIEREEREVKLDDDGKAMARGLVRMLMKEVVPGAAELECLPPPPPPTHTHHHHAPHRSPEARALRPLTLGLGRRADAKAVIVLTEANFDKVVRKAKKKGRPLLINFYSPPVCLHWPGQYAAAARQQKEMKHGAVFGKVDLSQQGDLAARLGLPRGLTHVSYPPSLPYALLPG